MSAIEPAADARPARSIRQSLALASPLLVVASAALLWLISDRLLYIGPLDRATFGWLVVVPLWAAAPLAAAVAWQHLSTRTRRWAAIACGLLVGALLAVLLWQASAFAVCSNGSPRRPLEWILPAITIGAIVGGGFGVMTLAATAQLRRGQRWRALLYGAIGQMAIPLVAFTLGSVLFFGICERPTGI